jgi:hypothetical protein
MAVPSAEAQLLETGTDIISLSDFATNAGGLLQQMRGTGHPVVLTLNGKAELVVQDAVSYQKLPDRVGELESLDAIKRGVADFDARSLQDSLRGRLGAPSSPGSTHSPWGGSATLA